MMVLYPYGLRKALTLSYDDGVETDIELIRILDEYGILATFNLNSGWFAPEGTVYPAGTIYRRMSESAIKALYAGGRHEVASHALTHASLSAIPAPRIAYEVLADRDNLEKLFGKIVRGFAYPYGTYSDEAVDTLRTCGIAYARTVVSTHNFEIPNEWLRLNPTCHHDDPKLDELCDRFGEPPRSVAGLLDVALIRSRAAALGIREIDQRVGSLLFYSDRIDRGDLLALTKALPGRVLMNAGAKPYLTVKLQKGQEPMAGIREVLTVLEAGRPAAAEGCPQ